MRLFLTCLGEFVGFWGLCAGIVAVLIIVEAGMR